MFNRFRPAFLVLPEGSTYFNTLNVELYWMCSFLLYWFFLYCPQSSQLIFKKAYFRTSEEKVHLMKSNGYVPLLTHTYYSGSWVPPRPLLPILFSNFFGSCYNIQFKPYAKPKAEIFLTKNRSWLKTIIDCCYIELCLKCNMAPISNS